jgi:hypothetical protein
MCSWLALGNCLWIPPSMSPYKTGPSTPKKDEHFREILKTHLPIVKSILSRKDWADPRYHYWDLNAGYGIDKKGRVGSSIEFIAQADNLVMDYRAFMFERSGRIASILKAHVNGNSGVQVIKGDHNITLPPLFSETSSNVFGMIYCDPDGKVPSFDLIGRFARKYNLVDVVIYISSANLKRGLMSPGTKITKRLTEYLSVIPKKHWIVREPMDKHQWTFLIGTNWTNFPVFERIGFHRADSSQGIAIMHRLNTTNEERKNGKPGSL